MTRSNPFRREIDVCRPGSNDLQLPELANLASVVASDPRVAKDLEASHAGDIVLCEALHDVAIPSGLSDRLMEQLLSPRRSAIDSALSPEAPAAANVDARAAQTAESPIRGRTSRRVWLMGLPAVAAAIAVAIGVFLWNDPQPKTVSEGQLVALVEAWYKQALPPQGWQTVDRATLGSYPIDPAVVRRPSHQRTMSIDGDSRGVAYDLTLPGRQRAILFVIRTPDHYNVGPLAYTRLPATGGKAVGAWQKGDLLYVLAVVEGDGQRISNFVRQHDLT